MKKRSFFERLSGSIPTADDFDSFDEEYTHQPTRRMSVSAQAAPQAFAQHEEEPVSEGQLPVDVYQTQNEIIIRCFTAGVRPDEINVSISRDMVSIEGSREEREQVSDVDYTHRELFWGTFSRTILLPQEIDVDAATAGSKDGLLTIVLPKLDKARQTKLRIKAG